MSQPPSRGRDTDREKAVELCEDDKRKLYALLDADLPARSRRLEMGMVALFVMSGSQVAALLGGPNPVTALLRLIF
jgi:hypothetical protein